MKRINKISLLSKERKLLFNLRNPITNGSKELSLFCDIVSNIIIYGSISYGCIPKRTQITNSEELKLYLEKLLGIRTTKENIQKARSFKKKLCINNKGKKNYIFYQFRQLK